MNKCYYRIVWENYPSDKTPLNEQNLNKIDVAVDEMDNRIISLDSAKFDKSEAQLLVKYIEYDEDTGIFKITHYNGASYTIDTLLEKLAINFDYDYQTQRLIIELSDGTIKYVDLSALITQYEFLDSDTVHFTISADGKVKADIKEGSIQEKHLRPDYLADIKVEVARAEAAATAADASKTAAAGSATTAAAKAGEAATSAENAANSAAAAEASKISAAGSASTASAKADEAAASEENAFQYADAAGNYNASAATNASTAARHANRAEEKANASADSADSADIYAKQAQSYAVGTGGVRPNEATENAKYYYEQSRGISEGLAGALMPMGTVTFANLPALSDAESGWMYNISNQFTTTTDFKEGAGNVIPAGSNVYKTADGYWDVLSGSPVTGIKGNSETSYRKGNVNLTPANIGALASNANAISASKWKAARNINGMSVDGTASRFNYGTCSTASGATEKTVSCTGFSLSTGAEISVKFSATNTAVKATLNVNNTGAKEIYYRGANIKSGYLAANGTYSFRYNGSQWDLVGEIDTSVNTWKANTKDSEGYVTKGSGQANKVWKTDADGNPAWRDENIVSAVTGVKGNAESAYRKGNVNITPANIGLGNVDNTADANKSVNYANSSGNADTVDGIHATDFIRKDGGGVVNSGRLAVANTLNGGVVIDGAYTYENAQLLIEANGVMGKKAGIGLHNGGVVGAFLYLQNDVKLHTLYSNGVDVSLIDDGGGALNGNLNASTDNTLVLGGYDTNWRNVYTRGVECSTGTLSLRSKEDNLYLAARVNVKCTTADGSGYIYILASAFNVTSSIRVKENVEELTEEEARKILDVKAVTFDYIEQYGGAKGQRGVIAEQVYKTIPSVVSMPNGYDESEDEPSDFPSVDYSKFVPYLIKMVQVQQTEIDNLKEKNQKLEERLARLEVVMLG